MLTFEIIDLPSGGMLFKGRLTQKKLAAKAKRQVFLCFPSSVQDVEVLHQHLKLQHTGEMTEEIMEEMTNKDMEIYGHLALSCISGDVDLYRISSIRCRNQCQEFYSFLANSRLV
jgi:hypothetical protein